MDGVAGTRNLFVDFDASVMAFDPKIDAVTLVNRMVSDGKEVDDTQQLAEVPAWEPRRMNNAICYLERVGAINARHSLQSRPWRAV